MSDRAVESATEAAQATNLIQQTIIELVQHTGSEKLKLVDVKLIPLKQWAREYAGYRFRHKEVLRILREEGQLPELPEQLWKLAEDARKAGDSFILDRAEITWEGDWVHPRWKEAAVKRAEAANQKQKEDLLLAEHRKTEVFARLRGVCDTNIDELSFEYTENSDSEDGLYAEASGSLPAPDSSRMLSKFRNSVPNAASSSHSSHITPEVASNEQKRKRNPEQSDPYKRLRVDALSTNPGVPAPSVPVLHALLPFDFRGLSKEARLGLTSKRTQAIDIVQVLHTHFNGSNTLQANGSWVREVSQTLPPCIACTKRNIKCVWSPERARCEFCCSTTKHLKCSFGDTLRWHRACSQIPDHDPAEIRKIFEETPLLTGSSDPFWYERVNNHRTSPLISFSPSDTVSLSP
ncbi:hypothetical protein J3R30DRAFT_3487267 [Lentinula aciculospora]|uniref:Uncharacterized protein n=1 Tax=Lentinula aciculospora TaxID=153920 RepID=A0A9W9A9B5_9AGAR|nr:hypothetical protein J3R30DRAFT_3487267 [Lentinula aciculospora]